MKHDRRRAVALASAIMLLVGLVLAIFAFRDSAIVEDSIRSSRRAASDTAVSLRALIRQEHEEFQRLTGMVADQDAVRNALPGAEQRLGGGEAEVQRVAGLSRYLRKTVEQLDLSAAHVVHSSGQVVATSDWGGTSLAMQNKGSSFSALFAEAMARGHGNTFVVDGDGGEPALLFASAIDIDGERRGVLILEARPSVIADLLPHGDTVAMISGSDGAVLMASEPSLVLSRIREPIGSFQDAEADSGAQAAPFLPGGRLPSLAFAHEDGGTVDVVCRCPFDGATFVLDEMALGREGWQIHVLTPLSGLSTSRRLNAALGSAMFVAGLFVIFLVDVGLGYLRRVREQGIRDPLTGLYNRAYIDQAVPPLVSQQDRGDLPALSVVIFDIDRFKGINDTYGHAVGDHVIKRLARILERESRRGHVVIRMGGEEFVVVLPGCEVGAAAVFAERVRCAAAAVADLTPVPKGRFTVSAGIAGRHGVESFDEVLGRADAYLYEAKTGGRNRIVVEEAPVGDQPPPLSLESFGEIYLPEKAMDIDPRLLRQPQLTRVV